MLFKYFLFSYFIKISFSSKGLDAWEYYINLHCRDNDNRPVDWWYIYKPPTEVTPLRELGKDFVFISSDKTERWMHSGRHIAPNSMLQHTLAPMFRPSYKDFLAVVAYEEKSNLNHPSLGILMADDHGGVWIGHTVPGLVNFTKNYPSFPEREMANGHLLMCLSVDLPTLNQLAVSLKEISPRFTRIQVPKRMRAHLPDWNFLEYTGFLKPKGSKKKSLDFITKDRTLRAKVMIRKPGDKKCLYTAFAKSMDMVLDVYGHNDHQKPYCSSNFSVRIIDQISMKSVEYVHYINKGRDWNTFAVSTAAYWQRSGRSGKDQYWVCTGLPDDSSGYGGLLLCADNFFVWQSFDNFKVKEPVC